MIEGLALPPTPPAAYVAHVETPALVLVKGKSKGNRSRNKRSVAPAVVVGAWVILSDGRQCRVQTVLPDGRVVCSEVKQ